MNFEVQHKTRYAYEPQIRDSFNEARLCPVSDDLQVCSRFDLQIKPLEASILRRLDFYTNQVYGFEMVEPHDHMEVLASSTVETFADARDFSVMSCPEQLSLLQREERMYDFLQASKHVPITPMIIHEVREIIPTLQDVQEAVTRILAYIDSDFTYTSGATHVDTPLSEIFQQRRGVCQDFAHVMIALCRAIGIPARYVSGYFWIDPQIKKAAADDNTASHAWVECFLPGIGWVGYDPTHNRKVNEIYIKVAVGRDYSDVKPLSGTYRGRSTAKMEVAVSVENLG